MLPLRRETRRLSYCWLRDHGTFTPVELLPAALIGCDGSRADFDPDSTLGLWLRRSIIIPLYLSSPPSGCNPDSDSSPLSLVPFREVLARSESTWLGILTPIQGTYLLVCLFSCLGPVKDNPFSSWDRIICPFTYKEWERPKLNGGSEKSRKKAPVVSIF